jgi:acetylornithine deacetylase
MRTQLTDAERAALDAVDDRAAADLLLQMLAVPSITGSAAESALQHQLAKWLDAAGLEVDLWSMDLPELAAQPDFPGTEAPRDEAWGLVAATPASREGPTLILQGHVDVVPPGDLAKWDGDPFRPRISGGVVHGRGA